MITDNITDNPRLMRYTVNMVYFYKTDKKITEKHFNMKSFQ